MARKKKLLGWQIPGREDTDCKARCFMSFGNLINDPDYPCHCNLCIEDERRREEMASPAKCTHWKWGRVGRGGK